MTKKSTSSKTLLSSDFVKGLIIGIVVVVLGYLLYAKLGVQPTPPENDTTFCSVFNEQQCLEGESAARCTWNGSECVPAKRL